MTPPAFPQTRRPFLPWAAACLLLATLVLGAPAASADATTFRNLLEDGMKHLVDAERRTIAGDIENAKVSAERAEARFRDAVQLDNRSPVPHRLGCIAASFAVQPTRALRWWEGYRARSAYGRADPDLPYLKAILFFYGAGKPAQAVQALTRMRAMNSRHRPVERDTLLYAARIALGTELLREGHHERAIREFREASRVAAKNAWERKDLAAAGLVGIAMRVATRWQEAEELFRHLVERVPEDVLWHWNLGLCIASQNRWGEAIPHYDTVIAMRKAGKVPETHRSDVDLVFLRRGNCFRYVALDQDEGEARDALQKKAEADLRQFTELYPKDPRGHRWLGELFHADRGDPHAAIPHFERAFELDRDCEIPLRLLVRIFVRHEPKPGADAEETAKRQAAWAKKREAYMKDLEEGRERRADIIKDREANSLSGVSNCE